MNSACVRAVFDGSRLQGSVPRFRSGGEYEEEEEEINAVLTVALEGCSLSEKLRTRQKRSPLRKSSCFS